MAEFDVPFSPPTFDVYRLEQESGHDDDTVISVKLTDECLTAIAAAHKRKQRLKLEVDAQGVGTVRIGDVSFRFSTQSLPPPHADAVSCQPSVGFKSRASVGLKYTIQATQNSFEETRAKAQKLMEEEKSRGTKDVNKSRNGKKTEVGRGLSGSHVAAALAHARASSLGVNKQNTSSVLGGSIGSRNASPNMNPAASAAAAQARTVSLRTDLMKKSLRERIIHICITMRYKSFDDIIMRLRKDGLPKEQDSRKNIEDILKEVSDFTDSGRVTLKPSLYPEVNIKWQWLSSEEKDHIRPMIRPNPSLDTSGSFAPSRKSGVDRVKAGGGGGNNSNLNTSTSSSASSDRIRDTDCRSSGSSSVSTTSSPEAAASTSPPKGSSVPSSSLPSSLSSVPIGKKRAAVSPLVEKEENDEDLYYSSTTSSKRKAHAPSSKTTTPPITMTSMGERERERTTISRASHRPVRQESASPPEDPTMAKEEGMEGRSSGGRGKSSKTTSVSPRPLIAPPTLAPPTQLAPPSSRPPSRASSTSPRTDWTSVYGAVNNTEEAEKYVEAFTACYAEYVESHAKLSKIADEFTAMEKELTSCQRGSRDAEQVESKIQSKYSYYEKDVDFIKLRNRHGDLRSKLMTIRSRLDSWESRRL